MQTMELEVFTETARGFVEPTAYRNWFQYPPIDRPAPSGVSLKDLIAKEHAPVGDSFVVYVSIPYCRVRCGSCSYFVALLPSEGERARLLDTYLERLDRHLAHFSRSRRYEGSQCRAVYVGGGTASLLSPPQFGRLISMLRARLPFAPDTEITLEGNPHEFTRPYLLEVREHGATRISVGFQSSQDDVLRGMLNSPHSANESLSAVVASLGAGFSTVNVDLLYRLPGQTFEQWRLDVETVLGLGPTSVTTYEYVVHERTVTARCLADGRMSAPPSHAEATSWYTWMRERMLEAGYIEYTSNRFCKPGHNQRYSAMAYAQGVELVGIGVKAYSYVNGQQFVAPKTIPQYERAVDSGAFPVGKISAVPTFRNQMERHVIFALHRGIAVDARWFERCFGRSLHREFAPQLAKLSANGVLVVDADGFRLSKLGHHWKNNVLEAFYDPEML